MEIDEGSSDQIFSFFMENHFYRPGLIGRGVIQDFENTEILTHFPLKINGIPYRKSKHFAIKTESDGFTAKIER